MFGKLAFRNMKRQIGNYLVYFVSVALTVAMLFSINSMIYSPQVQNIANNPDINTFLKVVNVIATLVTAFVLAYATSFMVKLRAKEFGLYLTMGMTKKNICSLFTLETLFLSIFAIVVGVFMGVFVYQGAMALLCKIMKIRVSFSAYTGEGFLYSMITSMAMLFLSNLVGIIYLGKVEIHQLLHGEKKEKKVKYPKLWCFCALLSFMGIVFCGIMAYQSVLDSIQNISTPVAPLLGYLGGLFLFVFFFHFSFAKGITGELLHHKKLCARGTNTFVLRHLSGKMTVSAIMIGILSVLITFAAIGENVALSERNSSNERVNQETPFDLAYSDAWDESINSIPVEKAEEIINSYCPIESSFFYQLYTNGAKVLGKGIQECDYSEYQDKFIALSDFNELLSKLEMDTITLENQYLIIDEYHFLKDSEFENTVLSINKKDYTCVGVSRGYPFLCYTSFYAVVPDEVIQNLSVHSHMKVYKLKEESFDANRLEQELTYPMEEEEGYSDSGNQFIIKECNRIYYDSMAGVMAVGLMFIAVVFVCMALAILSLKTMSQIEEDQRNYKILYQLGVGEEEQKKTLFRQTFSYFALPFALPILSNLPVGYFCYKILEVQGYTTLLKQSVVTSIFVTIILLLIYALYFAITYLNVSRNVIQVIRTRR